MLAHQVTGDPHGLDAGTDLAGLVLAEAAIAGVTSLGMPSRMAWGQLLVDLDSLGGGLLSLGVHPDGWVVPARTHLVLPPCALSEATWSGPDREEESWVFVTENPSVTAAALALPADIPVRLLCTVGTPSATELDTLARLADSGWRIAVRADFDRAGIQHVRAAMNAVPRAHPWRMSADDYTRSLRPSPFRPTLLDAEHLPGTGWDPALETAMRSRGRSAYEEGLLDNLVEDVRRGHPPLSPVAAA